MVVIILQYINASNQHIVHLKITQCYMSIVSQLKKEKKSNWLNNLVIRIGVCVTLPPQRETLISF